MCSYSCLCVVQEMGSCAVAEQCHWAHGVEDLDAGAFKFDFPLANNNLESDDWVAVGDGKKGKKPADNGKRPADIRTGRQPTQTNGNYWHR